MSDQEHGDEISREEMLSSFLTDDVLNDVSLRSTDGVLVRTNRFFLSARSKVFRGLFCGQFQEATSDVVQIGYKGGVLKAVVEYIISDSPAILQVDTNENSPEPPYEMEDVQTLVALIGAAEFFQLSNLAINVEDCLNRALAAFPSLSFAIAEACRQENHPAVKGLYSIAMNSLRINYNNLAISPKVALLSAELMETFLQDHNIEMDEKELFDMLRLWSEGTSEDDANERTDRFLDLLDYIKLEKVNPSLLSADIETSGLVPIEKLLGAYKIQALAAEELHGIEFQKQRLVHPLWTNSSSEFSRSESTDFEVDFLDYPPITRGIHQWTIQVLYPCKATWLGVASTAHVINKHIFLGNQKGGWVYGSNGAATHASICNKNFPVFVQGSRITFTLDLLPNQNGNGVLNASIDGGDSFNIFTGMRYELDGDTVGFLPAVSLRNPGRSRLLEIREISE